MLVSRDTKEMSVTDICKATIETVSENFADGVVAPLLFIVIGGAPLGWAYKAVNTLDSMIGYKNEKYLYLGRTSAILDDVVNWIPARLSVCFYCHYVCFNETQYETVYSNNQTRS